LNTLDSIKSAQVSQTEPSFLLPRAGRLFFKKEALLSSFITPLYPPVPIPRNATLRSKLTHQKSFAR
jgi:hypothetical protein